MAERKAEARAMAAAMQRMAAAQNMSAADAIASACDPEQMKDPCGDCDQSELHLATQQGLFQLWCRGGNLNPWKRPNDYSRFFTACALGNVGVVREMIAEVVSSGRLELRESNIRYSPLHVAVSGSRNTPGTPGWPTVPPVPPDHLGVVKLLLEARARANAKDIMGNTPLAFAAGSFSTEASLKIARVLVQYGADVRATDRYSQPLLAAPASCRTPGANLDAMRVLLELGADPDQICAHSRHLRAVLTDGLRSVGAMAAQVGAKKALALIDPAGPLRLRYGSAVTIDGIHSRPELNGQRAIVRAWVDDAGRYSVAPWSEDAGDYAASIKIKPENLKPSRIEILRGFQGSKLRAAPNATATAAENPAASVAAEADDADRHEDGGKLVILSGLNSRPELNGRYARVQRWLGREAGRYLVSVRPTDGATAALMIKVKPGNVTAAGDTKHRFNPDVLPPWRGLGPREAWAFRPTDKSKSSLQACFEHAVPVGAKLMLSCDDSDQSVANLTPKVQFLYSIFHLAGHYADPKRTRCWRFVLSLGDFSEKAQVVPPRCIMIDVLRGPLDCPEFLPRVSCMSLTGEKKGSVDDSPVAAAEPLMLVRYAVTDEASIAHGPIMRRTSTDDEARHAKRALEEGLGGPAAVDHVTRIIAASEAELDQANRTLAANEAWLDADFVKDFYARSEDHEPMDGFFRPSVLYPPNEEKLSMPTKRGVCAFCSKTENEEKFKQCAGCGGPVYCSRDCQRSHWKVHKLVCKKSAEELRKQGAGGGRTSVIFDITKPGGAMAGMVTSNISNSGHVSKPQQPGGKPPMDVHGGAEFLVKVQAQEAALFGSHQTGMPCMVYDETRSFQAYLDVLTPGMARLLELMRAGGVRRMGLGGKGYYMARREGANLRIFTDKIVRPPAW